ncbi:MAG: sulfurtransferase TusA family protein [Actinobacillus minor]|nr:sulfurtransferase TusA family protein [Actinobacillus minor]
MIEIRRFDFKSYLCPVPLLMARCALKQLPSHTQALFRLNKQSDIRDFELLCEEMGLILKEKRENEDEKLIIVSSN